MLSEQNLYVEDVYPGGRKKNTVILAPSPINQNQRVFAEALLEQSTSRQRRSPMDWALSFVIHFVILLSLLLLPLYFSQGIDMKRLETTLLVAPMPPMAPPPPAPPSIAHAVRAIPKVFTPGKLTAPTFIPKAVAVVSNDAAPPDEAISGMSAVPGGVPGGQIGGITGGMPSVAAPVIAAPAVEKPKGPVRIGGDVKQPRLLFGPPPAYPPLASQAHIQGTVVIDAIIDEHGNVVQEKVVSGHPLLVQAALKAVLQRKYEPTVLDGEPTPVDLRVEVNFHM
jgi:protein TonB